MEYGNDVMVGAISGDGLVSVSAVGTTGLTARMQKIHGTTPVATVALGRLLAAASLMSRALTKTDTSLTLHMNGGGPVGNLVAISDSKGNVRGFAQNPGAGGPPSEDGRADISAIVGKDGVLTVTRESYGSQPHIGAVALVSGDVSGDVQEYFRISEQIVATCALDVVVDGNGAILAAGGYIARLLPGASEKAAKILMRNLSAFADVGGVLCDGGADALLHSSMSGLSPRIISRDPVGYRCTCSHEYFLSVISSLGPRDLDDLRAAPGPIEICCQYCRSSYIIDI
jgi:molecular chaperone Hsp33